MAKPKTPKNITNSQPNTTAQLTLPEVKENKDIWYKLMVLLYDLSNIKSDPTSVARLERTLDELYISSPYFTTEEAGLLKGTLVEITQHIEDDEEEAANTQPLAEVDISSNKEPATDGERKFETVEEAIKTRLADFYDKRKASGDFRPCAPHDMLPVYLKVLEMEKGELEDDRFLGRLRRSGLGQGTNEKASGGDVKEGREKNKNGKPGK